MTYMGVDDRSKTYGPGSAGQNRPAPRMWVEEAFETVLFNCRFVVLVAVLGILAAAIVMFVKGSLEVVQGMREFFAGLPGLRPTGIDDQNIILAFVPAIDNYLFATMMLIIAMGLYELFISKIDPASRKGHTCPNWLIIKEMDDLKQHTGEIVVMILIVNYFKISFGFSYQRPSDLLMAAGGIVLVATALIITHHISGKRRAQS
jgi:uncharacterized membrane protein YqhA